MLFIGETSRPLAAFLVILISAFKFILGEGELVFGGGISVFFLCEIATYFVNKLNGDFLGFATMQFISRVEGEGFPSMAFYLLIFCMCLAIIFPLSDEAIRYRIANSSPGTNGWMVHVAYIIASIASPMFSFSVVRIARLMAGKISYSWRNKFKWSPQ